MTHWIAGRLVTLLLLCYSPAWRHRYGDELRALLADTHLSPRTVSDVAVAGIRQRAHAAGAALNGGITMTIGPAWRHPTAFAVVAALILLPTFVVVSGSILAYQLNVQPVRGALDPMLAAIGAWQVVDQLLVMAPVLAVLAAFAPLVRLGLDRRDGALEAVVSVRALALNMAVTLLALGLGAVLVWHFVAEAVLEARG